MIYWIFAILQVLDLVTTYIGLSLGAIEGNPLMAPIILTIWAPILKLLEILLIWTVFKNIEKRSTRAFNIVSVVGCSMSLGIVIHNMLVICWIL